MPARVFDFSSVLSTSSFVSNFCHPCASNPQWHWTSVRPKLVSPLFLFLDYFLLYFCLIFVFSPMLFVRWFIDYFSRSCALRRASSYLPAGWDRSHSSFLFFLYSFSPFSNSLSFFQVFSLLLSCVFIPIHPDFLPLTTDSRHEDGGRFARVSCIFAPSVVFAATAAAAAFLQLSPLCGFVRFWHAVWHTRAFFENRHTNSPTNYGNYRRNTWGFEQKMTSVIVILENW